MGVDDLNTYSVTAFSNGQNWRGCCWVDSHRYFITGRQWIQDMKIVMENKETWNK